ncbi:MAG TPA: creatininase family protein [Geminicoccaceae bacterium]
MLLECSTWHEVEAYLRRSNGIILPIGSTEQHGPTGLIGTDSICADVVARAVGEAADALVAPTVSFGMAQHHMAFPGTMTLRPETLLAVLVDLLTSLSRHGFERCFVINGHGGNMATAMAAFSEIHARSSLNRDPTAGRLRCRLRNWWSPPAVLELQKRLFGDRDGSHATASDISLSWHARPDVVRNTTIDPPLAPAGRGFTDADDFRSRYPDGRIGSDPSQASAEAGEQLLDVAVEGLTDEYRRFIEES